MALFDHFAPDAGPLNQGGNGFLRLSANGFSEMISLLLNEGDEVAARAELITKFNLDATDLLQVDEIIDIVFQGSPVSVAKQKEFRDVRASLLTFEGGFVNKLRAETNAGVTPS